MHADLLRVQMMTPSDSGASLKTLARAVELQQSGRLDEAEAVYAKLLATHEGDPTALINGGVLALTRNDVSAAIGRLEKAVAIVPNNAIAHANLGLALIRAGRDAEALVALDRAVVIKSDFAQAHNSRGIALAHLKRRDDAMRAFERALSLLPAYNEAALNLGELANQAGEPTRARSAYQRVLERDAANVLARTGIAFTDALEGRLDEAIGQLDSIVAAQPDAATAWHTLGALRNWSWKHAEAESAWRTALALAPESRDAKFGIASTLLARGRYEEGFAAFDASRAPLAGTGYRALPEWSGEKLPGTLVVHAEQGLGDVVQFARFLPHLRDRVERVVMLLDGYWAPLAPLLASLEGVDRVVSELEDEAAAARVSVLSLPRIAGATRDRLPQPPYLTAPPDRREAWRRRLAHLAPRRVGLAWSVFARDDHAYVTRHKSVPPEALAPLQEVPDVAFVSVQPGPAGDPSVHGIRAHRVEATGAAIRDFGDTAALVSELDLVITPDTAVAHVAGALGRPVWLLERFHGCWRWRLEAETSPWYPGLRIFRQDRFDDWRGAVARAAEALAKR